MLSDWYDKSPANSLSKWIVQTHIPTIRSVIEKAEQEFFSVLDRFRNEVLNIGADGNPVHTKGEGPLR